MKDSNKFTFKDLSHLFQSLKNYSFKINQLEPSLYCPVTERLLYILINMEAKAEGKSVRISCSHLGKLTSQNKMKIQRRIKYMAKFSLITVFNQWTTDGSGLHQIQIIRVNPKVKYILSAGAKANLTKTCIEQLFKVANQRDETEGDLQGFKFNIRYGDKEPANIKDIQLTTTSQNYAEFKQSESEAGDKILESIGKEDKLKAQRAKDNKFWREKSAIFANQAAKCWSIAQSRHGYGDALPNWSGDPKNMTTQGKNERNELIQTLKQYGGKVASLSWFIYCAGIQAIDPKTLKPAYDNMNPHRQFITTDRKPSQYAKHFNSIIASPDYKLYSTKKWDAILPDLKAFFGDTLDLLPRGMMTEASNPTGRVPGHDSGPSIEDLT